MIDKSMQDSYQISLPKDLLAEAKKQPKPKREHLKVEGFRTSPLRRGAARRPDTGTPAWPRFSGDDDSGGGRLSLRLRQV